MSKKRTTRRILRNTEETYKEVFRNRGVNHIDHYSTPKMYHPNAENLKDIELIGYVWKMGDRYSKLAYKFYGDPKLWWIIAWFNQMPTESHLALGDVIQIPVPLDKALKVLRG